MRLIDADALKEKIHSAGEEGTIANYCRNVMAGCLDNDAPTVNAIPVEWLEEQADYARFEWDYDTCEAIRIILKKWDAEQEA